MRNLLALSAAVLLAVAAFGWYRGWYSIGLTPGRGGHERVTVDINTPKVNEDIHKGEGKVQQVLQNNVQVPTETPAQPHHSHQPGMSVQVPPAPSTPPANAEGTFVLPGGMDVNVTVPLPGTNSAPHTTYERVHGGIEP